MTTIRIRIRTRTRTFARHVVRSLAVAAAALLVACGSTVPSAHAQEISEPAVQTAVEAPAEAEVIAATAAAAAEPAPLPAEPVSLAPTPAQTEGPYFTPNSPQRTSLLESGLAGTRLIVTGRVLGTDCRPIARALLDFWQADDRGAYDNRGFRLRGHQFADETGRYELETILPGLYTGRTRHIHVKVQAPNQPVLTTQLYFPDEPANETDGIFDPALVMEVEDAEEGDEGKVAFFTFALAVEDGQ